MILDLVGWWHVFRQDKDLACDIGHGGGCGMYSDRARAWLVILDVVGVVACSQTGQGPGL